MGWWSLTKPDLRVTGPMLSVHLSTLHQHDADNIPGQTVQGRIDTFLVVQFLSSKTGETLVLD